MKIIFQVLAISGALCLVPENVAKYILAALLILFGTGILKLNRR